MRLEDIIELGLTMSTRLRIPTKISNSVPEILRRKLQKSGKPAMYVESTDTIYFLDEKRMTAGILFHEFGHAIAYHKGMKFVLKSEDEAWAWILGSTAAYELGLL